MDKGPFTTSTLSSSSPASRSGESPQLFKHKEGPPRASPKNGTQEGVDEEEGPSPQEKWDEGSVPFWNLWTSSKRATSARGFTIAIGRDVQGSTPCEGSAGKDAQCTVPCEGPVVDGGSLGLRVWRDAQGCEGPVGKDAPCKGPVERVPAPASCIVLSEQLFNIGSIFEFGLNKLGLGTN